jgi:hypothetical protein
MSNITEILGSKKFAGGENKTLKTRVILEQPSKVNNEYNLFTNVSEDDQFTKEKQENNLYKIYGTIVPSVMKEAYFFRNKLNIDTNVPEFNKDNWSLVMCKPVKYLGTDKGRKLFDITYLDYVSKSDKVFSLDLNEGLPASLSTLSPFQLRNVIKSDVNIDLYMNLGHNLNIGDQIYIKSNEKRVPTGLCFIINVKGNIVTTDLKIKSTELIAPEQQVSLTRNTLSGTKSFAESPSSTNSKNANTGAVRGIQTTNDNSAIIAALKAERPTPYGILNPKLSVSKVINNEVLEYYVKQVEVIEVLETFDNCGFSKNLFDNQLVNFYFNKNFDINGLLDHKDEPLTECHIGIIKNGSTDSKIFSDVESNFKSLIDYTNEGEGIKTISKKSNSLVSSKPTIGENYDIGIYEYSSENLTEELIEPVQHNFILDFVLFKYTPFTTLTLKNRSSYIEDSVSNQFIPPYAKYSRKSEKYIWRDLLDIGISDENGEILDFPFLNGCRYFYSRLPFNVLIEKNKTKKYKLNSNDISNIDLVNNVDDYISSITKDLFGNDNNGNQDEPFKKYTNEEC